MKHLTASILLLLVIGCDRYEVVMSGLSQSSANEALVLLRENNIDAKKEIEPAKKIALYAIKVKENQSLNALRLLMDNRLAKTERASLKDIYPPGGAGLIPTKGEEHARFLMASQGEVEALLKIIPGIKDARVVLSFDPPSDLIKAPQPKTGSAVLLYQTSHENASPISDNDVKNLIASSINGLEADDITVVQKPISESAQESIVLLPMKKTTQKNIIWYMLALTIMALLLAFYGVVRLFLHRRARIAISSGAAHGSKR